jgi:hypothetical protein
MVGNFYQGVDIMPKTAIHNYIIGVAVLAALLSGPASADKPSWAGGDNAGKHAQKEGRGHEKAKKWGRDVADRQQFSKGGDGHSQGELARGELRFGEHQRVLVRDYYAGQVRAGRCPPGLAKKNNGCLPPGQAKKWQVGQPLPRDLIYYELPSQVVVQLGPLPGYRYVRVASDILLIAVGTGLVVDAIEDLGRM